MNIFSLTRKKLIQFIKIILYIFAIVLISIFVFVSGSFILRFFDQLLVLIN